MNPIARWIERIVFSSRWLVVPFLFGLIVGLAALIFKFGVKLVEFALHVQAAESTETITGLLGLVDLTLTANLDRKSTRLNSSHQIISYAVFCLKKKKTRKTLYTEDRRRDVLVASI